MNSVHRLDSWRGPAPRGPGYQSCGQRCPDCRQIVNVAGTWDDWDRIHGPVCAADHPELPFTLTPGGTNDQS